MLNCRHCHRENPDAARFCMHCGQSLSAASDTPAAIQPSPPLQGENRVVTVLFADIAGSTRLSEQLGAEPWHHLLSAFFAAITKVIERAGGTVNQYTGDGLMALFGAPRALEDHAARACQAALQAQERIRPLADTVRLEHGLNFGVRIGLNTGPVVVGSIAEDGRRDYTAQGATVHLAARMEQMAQPGSVCLAEATARLVDGYYALREIGPTQVKGLEDKVLVSELIGLGPARQRLDRSRHRGLSPFVGREQLAQDLDAAHRQALQGQSQVAVLRGDAGLGKSRLCLEMIEGWRARSGSSLTVLQCAAGSHGESQPLEPVRMMLRQWLGVAPTDEPAQARRAVAGSVMLEHPQLRDVLPVLLEFLGIAESGKRAALPVDARERQQAALFEVLCSSFCQSDVVLWVDDWHWLDAATRAYLQDWLQHLVEDSRVLVLLTTRPEPLPDWLQQMASVHELQPLRAEAMAELGRQLVGDWFPSHPLGAKLVAHAEGNPFFIEESIAHLLERGLLVGPVGRRELQGDSERIGLPGTVQALLAARLDSVAESGRRLLEAAALVGRAFSAEWVGAMLGLAPGLVEKQLFPLADAGFVEPPQGEDLWRFSHGLLQEEAAHRQLESHRKQLLKKLAGWLEAEIHAGRLSPNTWLQVAAYKESGGDLAAAAEAYLDGSRALVRTQLREGIQAAQKALSLCERLPPTAQAEALRFRIHASLLRGASLGPQAPEDVASWVAGAQAYLHRTQDPRGQVEFGMATGILALNAGDTRLAYARTRRAFDQARALGDAQLISRFRVPLLFTHQVRGATAAGLRILDELDQGAWRAGPPHLDNFLSRGFRALLLGAAGDVSSGVEELRRVNEFCEAEELPVSWMYASLAEFLVALGQLDEAALQAEKALQAAKTFGSPSFDAVAHRALACVREAQGEAAEALALLQVWTPAVAPGQAGALFASAHHEALARTAKAAGEEALAVEAAAKAVALARRQGQLYWLAQALITQAGLEAGLRKPNLRWAQRIIRLTGSTGLQPLWQAVAGK